MHAREGDGPARPGEAGRPDRGACHRARHGVSKRTLTNGPSISRVAGIPYGVCGSWTNGLQLASRGLGGEMLAFSNDGSHLAPVFTTLG